MTRATVSFYESFNNNLIARFYIHHDGNIEGVGHRLGKFLKDKIVINGLTNLDIQTMENNYANGMSDLAAQYVLSEKKGIGSFYICHSMPEQDYNYKVLYLNDRIHIDIWDNVQSKMYSVTPVQLTLMKNI